MVDLKIDVEKIKDQLADYAGDELLVRGGGNCVLKLNIEKVMFKEQDIKNKGEKLATVKKNLKTAQQDCLDWLNNVEPEMAKIPQGFINYSTLFATLIPQIRHELENETKESRGRLKEFFQGLEDKAVSEKTTLEDFQKYIKGVAEKITQDADNFSDSNQAFKQLETVDEKNLKTAKKVVDNLSALIEQNNKEITAKMIKEEQDLTIADIAIAAGGTIGHLYEPLEALGLAVGLVFIVSAGLTSLELQAAIEAQFQEAQEQEDYKLIITQLTEQLLSLHAASSTLKSLNETITSLDNGINLIKDCWSSIQKINRETLTALADESQKITDIISEFNLGQASAEWEEAHNFSIKMQDLPISQMTQKLTTIPPKKPE